MVFTDPEYPQYTSCKRVTTDKSSVKHLVKSHSPKEEGPFGWRWKADQGYVWMQGDNKTESVDSTHYGPIPRNLIVGRVILNLSKLKLIDRY